MRLTLHQLITDFRVTLARSTAGMHNLAAWLNFVVTATWIDAGPDKLLRRRPLVRLLGIVGITRLHLSTTELLVAQNNAPALSR